MLAGRNLVMLGFGKNAKLPQLFIQLRHKCRHTRTDRTKVMVFHLLPFGRLCAKQGAAGKNQILALGIILFLDQEILLLRADSCRYATHILTEQFKYTAGLCTDRLHRTQQRCLFIQDLTGKRTKRRRDIQRTVLDERIARRVPRSITARLKSRAQTAGRKGGSIRLALDQLLARKFHHHAAVIGRRNE